MIRRYTLPKAQQIWTDKNKFNIMLKIEILVCEELANKKNIPKEALENIKKAKIDLEKINEYEKETKHDVTAFVKQISESVGEDGKYIHYGLTSSDVLDTTLSIQIIQSIDLLLNDLTSLKNSLKKLAIEYKNLPTIGRTHGMHAEPITLGLKFANWYCEVLRNIERLKSLDINYGKISGAVGSYTTLEPDIEKKVLKKLGLKPEPLATQVVPRDRHAQYILTLSMIGSMCERIATEIRHLQRNEIAELQEPFYEKQIGSSAMPHKKNPVGCENICGLARMLRSYCIPALENIPLWHERDISHSSVERVILPDSTILADFILSRIKNILDGLVVNRKKILENLKITGQTYASEKLLLLLIKKGLTRFDAYRIIQNIAFKKGNFYQNVLSDKTIKKYLFKNEIKKAFNLNSYIKFVDFIFRRINLR